VLYVHGVPTASWDWLPYLERIGGIAPDLPGFGSSAKPRDFDYSIDGYARWLEAFVDTVGLKRFSLVVHDWGGLALVFAQRRPEHWIARIWRTPGLGEAFMATSSKPAFRLISRQSNVTPGPLPDTLIDRFWPDFGSRDPPRDPAAVPVLAAGRSLARGPLDVARPCRHHRLSRHVPGLRVTRRRRHPCLGQ